MLKERGGDWSVDASIAGVTLGVDSPFLQLFVVAETDHTGDLSFKNEAATEQTAIFIDFDAGIMTIERREGGGRVIDGDFSDITRSYFSFADALQASL